MYTALPPRNNNSVWLYIFSNIFSLGELNMLIKVMAVFAHLEGRERVCARCKRGVKGVN